MDHAPVVVAAPRVEKARWSLQSSIWRGRATRAYSQDFYDGGSAAARIHVELLERALRCDDGKLAQVGSGARARGRREAWNGQWGCGGDGVGAEAAAKGAAGVEPGV